RLFFFQAEDGIRDLIVTGVQTCALPIWAVPFLNKAAFRRPNNMEYGSTPPRIAQLRGPKTINEDIAILKNFNVTEKKYFEFRARSEERRVGKECRCRSSRDREKKKIKPS